MPGSPISQIIWLGLWPNQESYCNARYYELLRRFTFIKQLRLPPWKGVSRIEPLLASLLSRKNKWLFCSHIPLIKYWHGPVIFDIDDPCFTEDEVISLNQQNVRAIITTTEKLRYEFLRYGINKPMEVIPSGFSKCDADNEFAKVLEEFYNHRRSPIVGYSSAIVDLQPKESNQADISLLVEAMEIVWSKMDKVQLWILGQPTKALNEWAKKRLQVRLFGFIPRAKLLSYIQNFTVATYPRRVDHRGRFSIKLMEYMAMGIPTVGTCVSETQILRQSNAGILVETAKEFAEAVLQIVQEESIRDSMAKNALSFSAPYDWDYIAKDYQDKIFSTYINAK